MIVAKADIAAEGHLLDLLDVAGLEGEIPVEHEVEDDAQTECIDLVIIFLHLVNFRRDEPWSTCVFLPITQIFQFVLVHSEPKID